jgi:hypothetical protein
MGKTFQYGGLWHRISKKGCSNQFGTRWRNGGFVAPCPEPLLNICVTPFVDNTVTKIYLAATNNKIYSYDIVDDVFVQECNAITGAYTIGYHSDGAIYALDTSQNIRRVKLSNSTATLVSNIPAMGAVAGACFDDTKALYTMNFNTGVLAKVSGIEVLNDLNPLTTINFGGAISGFPLTGGGDLTFFDGELYMVGINTTNKIVKINFTNSSRTALSGTPTTVIGNIIDGSSNPVTGIIGMTVLDGVVYICNATQIYSVVIQSPNPVATLIATVPGGWDILDAACILESTNS